MDLVADAKGFYDRMMHTLPEFLESSDIKSIPQRLQSSMHALETAKRSKAAAQHQIILDQNGLDQSAAAGAASTQHSHANSASVPQFKQNNLAQNTHDLTVSGESANSAASSRAGVHMHGDREYTHEHTASAQNVAASTRSQEHTPGVHSSDGARDSAAVAGQRAAHEEEELKVDSMSHVGAQQQGVKHNSMAGVSNGDRERAAAAASQIHTLQSEQLQSSPRPRHTEVVVAGNKSIDGTIVSIEKTSEAVESLAAEPAAAVEAGEDQAKLGESQSDHGLDSQKTNAGMGRVNSTSDSAVSQEGGPSSNDAETVGSKRQKPSKK